MRVRLIVPILLMLATASFAQSAADQLKSLNGFAGTWKCTGTAFATDMGPEHPTSATVTGKWVLGGKWLEMRYTEEKTKKNPMPFSVVGYWGWDEGQKKLVAGSIDNMGGYAVQGSSGWSGDTLIFEGPVHMGPTTPNGRDTFTRSGKDKITHSFAIPDNAGGWKKFDEEICKK
jgi:hypothetical protein